MAKIGDTVRYLNTTGGGKITKIDGKIAFVEEDGFETPVLIKDLVVVLPAGQEKPKGSARLMFDQAAYDEGKREEEPAPSVAPQPKEEPEELPLVETNHGDTPNIILAFEPRNIKALSTTTFNAVLVNDSNYFLDFTFMRRSDEERGWTLIFTGTVAPNELIDLARLTHEDLPDYDRIALQAIAYKKEKPFTLQPPMSVTKNLDLTKFHKLHCFHQGLYFDTPVIEVPLVKNGISEKTLQVNAKELAEKMMEKIPKNGKEGDRPKKRDDKKQPVSPTKVLPLVEVDLHIGELTDTTAGMEPKDMLELQLSVVRRHMKEHSRRIGQKIVFIHGKGEGVLRQAVKDLLKKEYPKAEMQDASFREYGFGATLVIIH